MYFTPHERLDALLALHAGMSRVVAGMYQDPAGPYHSNHKHKTKLDALNAEIEALIALDEKEG